MNLAWGAVRLAGSTPRARPGREAADRRPRLPARGPRASRATGDGGCHRYPLEGVAGEAKFRSSHLAYGRRRGREGRHSGSHWAAPAATCLRGSRREARSSTRCSEPSRTRQRRYNSFGLRRCSWPGRARRERGRIQLSGLYPRRTPRKASRGDDRNRTGVDGFAGRCVATPPRRQDGI